MKTPKLYTLYHKGKSIGKAVPKHKAMKYYENMCKHVTDLTLGYADPVKPGKVHYLRGKGPNGAA